MERSSFQQGLRIADHAQRLAEQSDQKCIYLSGSHRKEGLAKQIAQQGGIMQGLVCYVRTVEPCQSFTTVPGNERPRLVLAQRKCLTFYFYFLDPKLGMLHVRPQAWFPLVMQICINGHEVLARKLDKHHIKYRQQDNAFTWIEDPQRAQRFADSLVKMIWPGILNALAHRFNPLLKACCEG